MTVPTTAAAPPPFDPAGWTTEQVGWACIELLGQPSLDDGRQAELARLQLEWSRRPPAERLAALRRQREKATSLDSPAQGRAPSTQFTDWAQRLRGPRGRRPSRARGMRPLLRPVAGEVAQQE